MADSQDMYSFNKIEKEKKDRKTTTPKEKTLKKRISNVRTVVMVVVGTVEVWKKWD